MHFIQRRVLQSLIRNPYLRYSQLKPKNVDANLFMYHLKQLIGTELVRKREHIYELTSKGKNMADKLQLENLELEWYTQPRLVLLLAVYDDQKGWLLHKRSVQPVINMVGFLHANIEAGESIFDSAAKRLKKLCGLKGSFSYTGSGIITMYQNKELESYIDFHLLWCQNPKGKLKEATDIGTNYWQKEADFADPAMMPSMKDLMALLGAKAFPFFAELSYKIKVPPS